MSEPGDAVMLEWHPIETAPHGVNILIFYKSRCDKGRIIKAFYAERYTLESEYDSAEYSEEKDAYFAHEGWYEIIDNWDDFSSVYAEVYPTHWMLLPEPPK